MSKRAKTSDSWLRLPEKNGSRYDTKWIAVWDSNGASIYEDEASKILSKATKKKLDLPDSLPLRQIMAFRYTNPTKKTRTFVRHQDADTYTEPPIYRTVVLALDGMSTEFDFPLGPVNVTCFGPSVWHKAPPLYPGQMRDVLILVYHNRPTDNNNIGNYLNDADRPLNAYVFEKKMDRLPNVKKCQFAGATVLTPGDKARAQALFDRAFGDPPGRLYTWDINDTGHILRARQEIPPRTNVVKGSFIAVGADLVEQKANALQIEGHSLGETHFTYKDMALFSKYWENKRYKPDWYLLNHSYTPNLEISFRVEYPDYELTWKALRPIKANEILTFSYNADLAGYNGIQCSPLDMYTVALTKQPNRLLVEVTTDTGEKHAEYGPLFEADADFVVTGVRYITEIAPLVDAGYKSHWHGSREWLQMCEQLTKLQPIRLEGGGQQVVQNSALPSGNNAWVTPFRATNGVIDGKLIVVLIMKDGAPFRKDRKLLRVWLRLNRVVKRLLEAGFVCIDLQWSRFGVVDGSDVLADVRGLSRVATAHTAAIARNVPFDVSSNLFLGTKYAMLASCLEGWDNPKAAECYQVAITKATQGSLQGNVTEVAARLTAYRTQLLQYETTNPGLLLEVKVFSELIQITEAFIYFDTTSQFGRVA